ncbi:hypothetical protein CVT25_012700 [Psilocybe cyanescens]|uniref:Uncharacterized protein n=1 Tax=Psilocybe cyanescens TaxID=93625 RepID=A0A409VN27_PSICY|nr:hypothetical protein CVT25_012700 [Psilocybe cyanescens]
MATGILLHSYTDSLHTTEPYSSSSSFASNTPALAPPQHITASHPRRSIRFAPLPDPRRAVLITDEGDELPIAVPPDHDLNHIPASLLALSPPSSPLPRTNEIRNETNDERENSSGSSTNSYLSSSSSTSASSASTPRTTTPSDASPLSSLTSSPVTAHSPLPATKCSPPLLTSQNPPSWPKPRNLSLLRPFKRSSASSSGSSSHSLTPTPSIEATQGQGHSRTARKALALSTEEILTLGAINLFRTSSRESTDSASTATNSGWGLGLSRWTSANGADKSAAVLNGSSPLSRTQSTQSYKSKSKFTSSLSSEPKSVSQPAHSKSAPVAPSASRHKGTRMLNGRVYGSKRPSPANPFANARDDEDEFVEWGYGGMGSVKGAKSAGMAGSGNVNWERLHGGAGVNGRAPKQGVGGGVASPVAAADDDDGSGMGWVKRRREERERKKKEEEEKAAREKEKEARPIEEEVTESKMSTPTPTRTSTMDGGMLIADENENENEAVEGPTSAATVVPSSFVEEGTNEKQIKAVGDVEEMKEGFVFGGAVTDEPDQEKEREHAPVVVPVLMRPRHQHHHSSHRHGRSMSGSGIKPAGSKELLAEETAFIADSVETVAAGQTGVHHDSKRESVSSLSTSGSDEDTDEDEEGEDGGDENDDDEDDDEEADRKTALGAGVEKVSRHKE